MTKPKAKKPARKPAKKLAKKPAKRVVRRKLAPKAAATKPAVDPRQTFIPGTEPGDDDNDGEDYMHVARATHARRDTGERAKATHIYFSDDQRAEIDRLAAHLSKPWRRCTANEAVRRAFVEGAKMLLAKPAVD